jgi:membrane protease YdiL (CAAX protease family)
MEEMKKTGSGRFIPFIMFIVCGLVVFFISITFSPLIPDRAEVAARIVIAAVLLLSATLLYRTAGLSVYWRPFFGFSIAMTALLLSWKFSHLGLDLFGLSTDSPQGLAVAKLSESILIVLTILIAVRATGGDFGSLYLKRGRLGWGLLVGIVSFCVLALLATFQALGQGIPLARIVSWTPWILLFVLANGFMEELLFRGLFLKRFEPMIGAWLSNLVIAVVFTAAHAQVTYTPDLLVFLGVVFLLSLAWGYIMQKTDSLLASFLFHAGGDMLIIVPIFITFGIEA